MLIVLAGATLLSTSALACSCLGVGEPACQAAGPVRGSAIFLARVTKIEILPKLSESPAEKITLASESRKQVTLGIEEGYRGVNGNSVNVLTAEGEGACGYPFVDGERYLVYAGIENNKFYVSLCSSTKPAKFADEDIAYLRSMPNLPKTSWVYGTLKRYTYDPNFKPSFEPSIMDHYRPPEETYQALAPMEGTLVQVKATDGTHTTVTDKLGNWRIEGLRPGKYEISAVLPKGMALDPAWGIRGELSPKGCSQVELRAEFNGHIRGRIESDVPLSDYRIVQVVVFRTEIDRFNLKQPFKEALPDFDTGNYDVGPLPPGSYFLAVILYDQKFSLAVVFYPNALNVESFVGAKVITLGGGESKTHFDFKLPSGSIK